MSKTLGKILSLTFGLSVIIHQFLMNKAITINSKWPEQLEHRILFYEGEIKAQNN